MALGKYNRRTVMADTGAVISGATVTFYKQLTGLPVTAYDDPGGMDPLGSSIVSGDDGEVEVFLPPGKYRITTELGSYSDEITYEPVTGDIAVVDAGDVAMNFLSLPTPGSNSLPLILTNGFTDYRTLTQIKSDLALNNVNNTSDVNKPVSIATQLALDLKASNDDSRLSDAREWSTDTVDQSEAETGAATTRRAWTAQRVRQAIVAWWSTVGTTVGKALLNLNNPSATRFLRINADNTVSTRSGSEMRTDLGLGTVATLNAGTTAGTVATGDHTHADATISGSGFMSAADKTKLDGIATAATANQADAHLLDRANHTGVQALASISGAGVTAPTTASDPGTPGQITYDGAYVYICTATDTWLRVAIETW